MVHFVLNGQCKLQERKDMERRKISCDKRERKKFFDPQRPNGWRRVHEVQFIANRLVSFNLFFVQPTLHMLSDFSLTKAHPILHPYALQ